MLCIKTLATLSSIVSGCCTYNVVHGGMEPFKICYVATNKKVKKAEDLKYATAIWHLVENTF